MNNFGMKLFDNLNNNIWMLFNETINIIKLKIIKFF